MGVTAYPLPSGHTSDSPVWRAADSSQPRHHPQPDCASPAPNVVLALPPFLVSFQNPLLVLTEFSAFASCLSPCLLSCDCFGPARSPTRSHPRTTSSENTSSSSGPACRHPGQLHLDRKVWGLPATAFLSVRAHVTPHRDQDDYVPSIIDKHLQPPRHDAQVCTTSHCIG